MNRQAQNELIERWLLGRKLLF